jgi:hypothetical protein
MHSFSSLCPTRSLVLGKIENFAHFARHVMPPDFSFFREYVRFILMKDFEHFTYFTLHNVHPHFS